MPEAYRHWRPLVRDAMRFTVSHLSAPRLAARIAEQIQLPPDTPAECRLLRLISKVPALQKIGQVLARNRHFQPRFRRALSQLENGISDVEIDEIQGIIRRELGPQLERYNVLLDTRIASEASVSAVVRFTWHNPQSGRRERGVFKVMKPYIPGCYEEDLLMLEKLAKFLARRHARERSGFEGLAETLGDIRRLLAHEVDFGREQLTLGKVEEEYGAHPGVRVPRLIKPLSTRTITALSHENGVKVTNALRRVPGKRVRLAEEIVEALIGLPILSRRAEAVFHGDPHAGNLLYDVRRGELVILDWALAESLTHEQRRYFALLLFMLILRDGEGVCEAIDHLRLRRQKHEPGRQRVVKNVVVGFLRGLPILHVPGAMDAVHLLDLAARAGVRFSASLAMFRKAVFTLDGVVEDVAGATVHLDTVLKRYALEHWAATGSAFWLLFSPKDWLALQWSLLTFSYRMGKKILYAPIRWVETAAPPQAIAAEPTSG